MENRWVLLIEKTKPEWQKGLLNGIGGKIEDFDMFPIDAMVREFKEETGIDSTIEDWEFKLELKGDDFSVAIFKSTTINIYKREQTTEEFPVIFGVDRCMATDKTISNIPMIISALLDKDLENRRLCISYLEE